MGIEFQKVMRNLTCLESKHDYMVYIFRGGCALVWLAKNKETGEKVALKQFPKNNQANGVKNGFDPTA